MLIFAENSDDWCLLRYWVQAKPGTVCLRVSRVLKLAPHPALPIVIILLQRHITHLHTILVDIVY